MPSAAIARERRSSGLMDGIAECRKSSRHLADDLDVARGRLEDGPEHATEDHSGERGRHAGSQALEGDEHGDQSQAQHRRQRVRLANAGYDLAELTQEFARVQRDAEELAELPGDDAEPGAVEKTGQDRDATENPRGSRRARALRSPKTRRPAARGRSNSRRGAAGRRRQRAEARRPPSRTSPSPARRSAGATIRRARRPPAAARSHTGRPQERSRRGPRRRWR